MNGRPQQLALALPHRPAMGREDFMVSAVNSAAVEAIDTWPDWPNRALAIVGPAGAGKSHLVEVWRAVSGGARLAAGDLNEAAVAAATSAGAAAVEDIDRGIGDQRVMFHLLNLARETPLSLLLTSRSAPGELEIQLPDLRSRLRAMAMVRIEAPDEALLRALLVKLFADRQIKVEPHVIAHLALHMERSADAANRLVAEVDRLALEKRGKVTRALAAAALAELAAHGGTDSDGR